MRTCLANRLAGAMPKGSTRWAHHMTLPGGQLSQGARRVPDPGLSALEMSSFRLC